MVSEATIIQELTDRVLVTKKVRINVPKSDEKGKVVEEKDVIKETITSILHMIDRINASNEFTTRYFGRDAKDFIIANEWKDFFIPSSVRLDPTDLKTRNLLETSVARVKDAEDVGLYVDWTNLQLQFRSWYKLDLSANVTTLDAVRQPKSLFDVLPICTIGGEKDDDDEFAPSSVRSLDEPFVPVRLKSDIAVLFRSDYWNMNVHGVVVDYCNKFMV